MASPALEALFADYAAYHRHPKNKLCHYVGIPLIVFTLVGLLWRSSPAVALVVVAGALLYQLRLSPVLTSVFGVFVAVSLFTAPRVPAALLWAGFIAGWGLQFLGHYAFEKKSPAFFKNLQQLLVGPLWILGSLARKRYFTLGPEGMPSSRAGAPGSTRSEDASRTS